MMGICPLWKLQEKIFSFFPSFWKPPWFTPCLPAPSSTPVVEHLQSLFDSDLVSYLALSLWKTCDVIEAIQTIQDNPLIGRSAN
jgi:hypothetical protein